MAPPAKRRRRNVVAEDSDPENDGGAGGDTSPAKKQDNTLKRYLVSSPDGKSSSLASPIRIKAARLAETEPGSPTAPASRMPTRATAALPAPSAKTNVRPTKVAKLSSDSPEKGRPRGKRVVATAAKKKGEEKGRSADLVSMFSRQSQRSSQAGGGSANGAAREASRAQVRDDIISDPISDDEVLPKKAPGSSVVGKNAQKRLKGSLHGGVAASTAGGGTGAMFLRPPPKPPAPLPPMSSGTPAPVACEDARPWSERFGPANLEELAVHKKKVADVRTWLEDVLAGRRRQRLLVLKGAAGTAKTTALRLLARDMHVEVLEWRNPANALGATHGYQSATNQFEEFLGRGGKFGQLDVESQASSASPNGVERTNSNQHRLILIEEFPNTFMRSSSVLRSFRNTILQFLAANTPSLAAFSHHGSADPVIPVVMIISETLLTTTSASADSFTAHRLLGPEILRHPGTGVIEFNAIAPTILAKALQLVVLKEARKSGRRKSPGPLVLQRLGEIGDIRSAISALEFLLVKGDDDTDWGSRVALTKPKKGGKDTPALTQNERDSLELVSRREASLGIFHAVGKIVYNKRDDLPFAPGSTEAAAETLPAYQAHLSRPKRSQVAVDTLMDETGTDTHTFISALHENYALSCEQTGPNDPNSSLDYINGCVEHLSESDLLCPSWDVFFGAKGGFAGGDGRGGDAGSHVLRQDEMAFQTVVRGLLFCLPSPVRRQTHPGGGGDTFKMFYPTSLKLWREKEELEGLIDLWATKMLQGEDGGPGLPTTSSAGPAAFKRPGTAPASSSGGGTSASAGQPARTYLATQPGKTQPETTDAAQTPAPPLLALGTSARHELLLERLPYMAHVARRKRCGFGTLRARDLDRIVAFRGIGPPKTDESDAEDASGGEDVAGPGGAGSWATDRPTEEASPRRRRGMGGLLSRGRNDDGDGGESASSSSGLGMLGMQGLVISDDDIEDD